MFKIYCTDENNQAHGQEAAAGRAQPQVPEGSFQPTYQPPGPSAHPVVRQRLLRG